MTAIATIALWSDGFTLAEMRDVARDVRKRLYTLVGVQRIELIGVQEERVYLELSPAKLAQFGVAPQEIFGQLARQNVIEPGGEIKVGDRTVLIEPSGNFDSVDEIRNVVFSIPNSDQVARLDQIVDVRRGLADPPEFPAFFNDHPAIILSVSTVEGTNNVEFGRRLTALVDEIEQELLIGYVLEYATFQPELIDLAIQEAVSNVYQTLAIVLVVVMLFLGLRTGLIVGSFVPLTMLLGIIVMRFLDVEFQRMSIAAMIIALGLLVDNGIVVAEGNPGSSGTGCGSLSRRNGCGTNAGRTAVDVVAYHHIRVSPDAPTRRRSWRLRTVIEPSGDDAPARVLAVIHDGNARNVRMAHEGAGGAKRRSDSRTRVR